MRINEKQIACNTPIYKIEKQLEALRSGFVLSDTQRSKCNLESLLRPVKEALKSSAIELPAIADIVSRLNLSKEENNFDAVLEQYYLLSHKCRSAGDDISAKRALIDLKSFSNGADDKNAFAVPQGTMAIAKGDKLLGTTDVFECVVLVVRQPDKNLFGLFHADRDTLSESCYSANLDRFFNLFPSGKKTLHIYGGEKNSNDNAEWSRAKSNRHFVIKYLLSKSDIDVIHFDVNEGSFPKSSTFSISDTMPFKTPKLNMSNEDLQQGILNLSSSIFRETPRVSLAKNKLKPVLYHEGIKAQLKKLGFNSMSTQGIEAYFRNYYRADKYIESEIAAARDSRAIIAVIIANIHAKSAFLKGINPSHQCAGRGRIIAKLNGFLQEREYYIGSNSNELNSQLISSFHATIEPLIWRADTLLPQQINYLRRMSRNNSELIIEENIQTLHPKFVHYSSAL